MIILIYIYLFHNLQINQHRHLEFENQRIMVFLTNEFTKKAEITILSARESTRPGLQAGALWVERKAYMRESVARDSHLGL